MYGYLHLEKFINEHEWQTCKRDVTLEYEISCIFLKFPCLIHAAMHVLPLL